MEIVAVPNRARILLSISVCLAVVRSLAAEEVQPAVRENPPSSNGAKVLILGDSLALCGFGQRLDERFRKSPLVKATFTYITCGTNPPSWLKGRRYTHIQTHCGFGSIVS